MRPTSWRRRSHATVKLFRSPANGSYRADDYQTSEPPAQAQREASSLKPLRRPLPSPPPPQPRDQSPPPTWRSTKGGRYSRIQELLVQHVLQREGQRRDWSTHLDVRPIFRRSFPIMWNWERPVSRSRATQQPSTASGRSNRFPSAAAPSRTNKSARRSGCAGPERRGPLRASDSAARYLNE